MSPVQDEWSEDIVGNRKSAAEVNTVRTFPAGIADTVKQHTFRIAIMPSILSREMHVPTFHSVYAWQRTTMGLSVHAHR